MAFSKATRTWIVLLFCLWVGINVCAADVEEPDWPQFRGPTGQGHATATGLPVTWSNQADGIVAFNPASGEELWWVAQENYAQVPRPVFGHGLVFVCGGYFKPALWAIRPEGRGDVTGSHVVWRMDQGAPLNPSVSVPVVTPPLILCQWSDDWQLAKADSEGASNQTPS